MEGKEIPIIFFEETDFVKKAKIFLEKNLASIVKPKFCYTETKDDIQKILKEVKGKYNKKVIIIIDSSSKNEEQEEIYSYIGRKLYFADIRPYLVITGIEENSDDFYLAEKIETTVQEKINDKIDTDVDLNYPKIYYNSSLNKFKFEKYDEDYIDDNKFNQSFSFYYYE